MTANPGIEDCTGSFIPCQGGFRSREERGEGVGRKQKKWLLFYAPDCFSPYFFLFISNAKLLALLQKTLAVLGAPVLLMEFQHVVGHDCRPRCGGIRCEAHLPLLEQALK